MSSTSRFTQSLIGKMLIGAEDHVKQKIPSRTLRNNLEHIIDDPEQGRLYLDYYWALYVNDGRGAKTMPRGKYMVWYHNRNLDPRLKAGVTPARVTDLKHLSKKQFRRDFNEGLLILARKTAPVKGHYFFNNNVGMLGFRKKANKIGKKEFSSYVLEDLAREKLLNVKGEITLSL